MHILEKGDEHQNKTVIEAIKTHYKGVLYRSRLEARWAVFFDMLGIDHFYEYEGFNLGDGLYYLPDFWLPRQKIFIEIKGPFINNNWENKAAALATASGYRVVVDRDIPSTLNMSPWGVSGEGAVSYYPNGTADYDYWWCISPCCNQAGIEFNGRSERIPCCAENAKVRKNHNADHPAILMAYVAAKNYKFGGR